MTTPASTSANSSTSKHSKRTTASTSSAGASTASTNVSASSRPSNGSNRRRRPKKTRAEDNGSNSDADSAVACVDDERAGSTIAKRIAMLAKADTRTQHQDLRSEISSNSSLIISEGTVSLRALKRARMAAKGKEKVRPGDENVHDGVESTISSSSSAPLRSKRVSDKVSSNPPAVNPLAASTSNIMAPSPSNNVVHTSGKSTSVANTAPVSEPALSAIKSALTPEPSTSAKDTALTREPDTVANSANATEVCRNFQKFRACPFQDKCIHRHVLPDGVKADTKVFERRDGRDVCRTYWRLGRCPFGHRCIHRHVNKAVTTIWHTAPDTESTTAPSSGDSGSAIAASVAASSITEKSSARALPEALLNPVDMQSKLPSKEICKKYQAGNCKKSDCPRLHLGTELNVPATTFPPIISPPNAPEAPISSNPIVPLPSTTAKDVCHKFLAGKCKLQRCKRLHPTEAVQARSAPPSIVTSGRHSSKDTASPAKASSKDTSNSKQPGKAASEVSRTSNGSNSTVVADEKGKAVPPKMTGPYTYPDPPQTPVKASSSRSTPISRESSLSSGSYGVDSEWGPKIEDVDWSEGVWQLPDRVMTTEEERIAWDTSSSADESGGPRTPPASLRSAGVRIFDSSDEREAAYPGVVPVLKNEHWIPICRNYAQRGSCPYGDNCKYRHSHPHPNQQRQVCMAHIRGYCPAGRRCTEHHIQSRVVNAILPSDRDDVPVNVKVFDYIQVTFGTGFQILAISTAFESGRMLVQNVPHHIDMDTLCAKLRQYGTVLRAVWRQNIGGASGQTAYVSYQSKDEAAQAVLALNDAVMWETTIYAKVLAFMGSNNGLRQRKDSNVRIIWDAPGRVGYAGYESRELAEEVVARTNNHKRGDCTMEATLYNGLPALGQTNIRFWLPSRMEVAEFRGFARTHDVMLDEPNYHNLRRATDTLHCMAGEYGPLAAFRPLQPAFKSRRARLWLEYTTAAVAAQAVIGLDGLRLNAFGPTPLEAQQVYSLEYQMTFEIYDRYHEDFELFEAEHDPSRGLPSVTFTRKTDVYFVRLYAQDPTALARIKREYERIERGDDVQVEGSVIWDDYFTSSMGKAYLQGVEVAYPDIRVRVDKIRRKLTVLGPVAHRENVIDELIVYAECLAREKTAVIPLTGNLVGLFMSAELMELQRRYGETNVVLNIAKRVLAVRGTDEVIDTVRVEILKAAALYPASTPSTLEQCPACGNEVNEPVHLRCGHQWCSTCLTQYLSASTDGSIFPLACFGSDGTCTQPIPLTVARRLLPADRFDAIAHAAFRAHVHARPHEFRHCPTADCSQIYRPVPEGVILSCPACLVRICGRCSQEAHDGTPCTSKKADDQFAEWKSAHDVKACPGCRVPIEKAEGCNHMTCTQCRTHICWTCLQTFQDGNGIYNHMREVHGGIGLVP